MRVWTSVCLLSLGLNLCIAVWGVAVITNPNQGFSFSPVNQPAAIASY